MNRIFNRLERFTHKERQTALKGYLKTFRVDGQKGLDPQTFIANIKPKVIDLINQQKKPIKTKFIFTCKFIKENPATSQIDENSGYFHTNVEVVTAATDFSALFTVIVTRLLELVEQFQNNGSGNNILISNSETSHYCWIKNMSRLLSAHVNNHQHERVFLL